MYAFPPTSFLEAVGDGAGGVVEPGFRHHGAEFSPACADEGDAEALFVFAWGFADEEDLRVWFGEEFSVHAQLLGLVMVASQRPPATITTLTLIRMSSLII